MSNPLDPSSRRVGCTVTVAAGIHIGPPGEYRAPPEQIQEIIEAIPRIVEAILERIVDKSEPGE